MLIDTINKIHQIHNMSVEEIKGYAEAVIREYNSLPDVDKILNKEEKCINNALNEDMVNGYENFTVKTTYTILYEIKEICMRCTVRVAYLNAYLKAGDIVKSSKHKTIKNLLMKINSIAKISMLRRKNENFPKELEKIHINNSTFNAKADGMTDVEIRREQKLMDRVNQLIEHVLNEVGYIGIYRSDALAQCEEKSFQMKEDMPHVSTEIESWTCAFRKTTIELYYIMKNLESILDSIIYSIGDYHDIIAKFYSMETYMNAMNFILRKIFIEACIEKLRLECNRLDYLQERKNKFREYLEIHKRNYIKRKIYKKRDEDAIADAHYTLHMYYRVTWHELSMVAGMNFKYINESKSRQNAIGETI